MVPVHHQNLMTDTGPGGIPWLVTTQAAASPFSTPSPHHHHPHHHPFSVTSATRTAVKRDSVAALMGAGSAGATTKPSETSLVLSDVLGLGLQVLDFTMSYLPTSVPYVPFTPTQPPTMSVTTAGSVPSPNSAIMASVDLTNDPITKAVMENVLGRLPTKKPRVTVRCDVCNLEFSSQTVLDSHLAGSKHQRKVKSAELMKTLEETETGFQRDEVSGVIRCIVCEVTVNSPQLLATHIAGNKHKQRAAKRAGDATNGSPAKRLCSGVTGQDSAINASSNGGTQNTPVSPSDSTSPDSTAPTSTPARKTSGAIPVVTLNIPDCVTKLEETKGGGKYLCNPCQAHCNSEQQLAQHLSSRKHQDKLSGRKPKALTWRGGRRRGNSGYRGSRGGGNGSYESHNSHTYTQPLSSTFVAGGALM
ncbi:hypothetical protein Pmani_008375 [Petrolisthes manimaculis]|uniref:C2H2-type domain-containing protein n=1 Tax=Petrolisthes manimaculis TaxID=1843537 RepID=A0AAE1UJ07_9EUCA|nr:hypothetical protein Pmani_008375 [Petrolisthes manimaculis]